VRSGAIGLVSTAKFGFGKSGLKDISPGFKILGREGVAARLGTGIAAATVAVIGSVVGLGKIVGTATAPARAVALRTVLGGAMFVVESGLKPAFKAVDDIPAGIRFVISRRQPGAAPGGGLVTAGTEPTFSGIPPRPSFNVPPPPMTDGKGFEPRMEVVDDVGNFQTPLGTPLFIQDAAILMARARAGGRVACNCNLPASSLSQGCRNICGK